jgi:DMSO/TMAO reductase YedYZ molybdopterin-dependent catalytic subunit/predicted lipoprotein with Yx(FWY)xxD motif
MKRIVKGCCRIFAAIFIVAVLVVPASCKSNPKITTSLSSDTISDSYKPGVGYFLTDGSGRTLYWTLTDTVGQSNIAGTILANWPIFYVQNISVPLVPKMESPPRLLPQLSEKDFNSITRADGSKQTTFKGWPLYYYYQDKTAHDSSGQGVDGKWFVVNPQSTYPVPPAISISSPFNGAILSPGSIKINVQTINFNPVDKIGHHNAPGEGHINYFLDTEAPTAAGKPAISTGGKWAAVAGSTYTFNNVPSGTHTISVELVNNNQTPLVPPVVSKVTFVVGNVTNSSLPTGEIEATEYLGQKLTPIKQQNNNAISGTQYIDKSTYNLTVDGLVDHPLSLSYAGLQAFPQESQVTGLYCVDGWNFTAKWTGPTLNSIFNNVEVKPEAKIAIFYTADDPQGYTSLDLNYIRDNNIIIALKDNDVTLSPDRGFPFQVVAMSKYGYKWAKWVTRIELSSNIGFLGYWEMNGYNNGGSISLPTGQ